MRQRPRRAVHGNHANGPRQLADPQQAEEDGVHRQVHGLRGVFHPISHVYRDISSILLSFLILDLSDFHTCPLASKEIEGGLCLQGPERYQIRMFLTQFRCKAKATAHSGRLTEKQTNLCSQRRVECTHSPLLWPSCIGDEPLNEGCHRDKDVDEIP